MKNPGQVIAKMREESKFSQKEIAAMVGISPRYLRMIENGDRPGKRISGKIANAAKSGTFRLP